MADMMALRLLCERMSEIRVQKDRLEEELAEVNKAYDKVRIVEIPEMMEALDLKNATFHGLGRVQLAADLYASTIEGKKAEAMQWLRDCGYDGMIMETYNASTIKALFRRMIEAGTPIPDDIFKVTPFTRASLVKT
jgi:hypothetical protein